MLERLNAELSRWLTELGRSRWMAQVRLLLGGFGISATLLYLSTEFAGKILARVRSSGMR